MAAQLTFLQLADEFGGHKFGPFSKSEIRVGSDENNDIKVPARLGVLGQHLRIYQREDGSFVLAPVERTSTVFWWRGEQRQPKVVDGPTACMAGDRFALVTPDGPRFTLVREKVLGGQKAAAQVKAENFGKGMAKEVGRRAFASLTANPLVRPWVNMGRFLKTGQWRSPVYILPFLLSCTGICSGGGAAMFARANQAKLVQAETERDQCIGNAGNGAGGGKRETPNVVNITSQMLGGTWAQSFRDDGEFKAKYVEELQAVFKLGDGYKHYYANEDSAYFKLREALKLKGMEPSLIPLFASLIAEPNRFDAPGQEPAPRPYPLAGGVYSCGRGIAGLTWWQAKRFGVDEGLLAKDVYYGATNVSAMATEGDEAAKAAYRSLMLRAVYRQTSSGPVAPVVVDPTAPPPDPTTAGAAPIVGSWLDRVVVADQAGGSFCEFEAILQQDARTDLQQTAAALSKFAIGDGLPKSAAMPYYGEAQLVSFFAAAWNEPGLWEKMRFNQTASPSLVLGQAYSDDETQKTALKSLAVGRAAKMLARTVGMACFQALAPEGDKQAAPKIIEGDADPLVPCLIMRGLVEYGRATQ